MRGLKRLSWGIPGKGNLWPQFPGVHLLHDAGGLLGDPKRACSYSFSGLFQLIDVGRWEMPTVWPLKQSFPGSGLCNPKCQKKMAEG